MEFQLFQTVAALGSIGLVGIVLELIRRRSIQDELWLPWLALSAAPLFLSLSTGTWGGFARSLGVIYEPSLLLALGLLMAFAMLLYLSTVVSRLIRHNLLLAQEVAVLRARGLAPLATTDRSAPADG